VKYLAALGCKHGQGYYFARPLAPEAIAAGQMPRV
jgi:EAL domain-containing protein (putative c-di-GMP-specific phosphodiesterase class I)